MKLKNLNEMSVRELVGEINCYLEQEYGDENMVSYREFTKWYENVQAYWNHVEMYVNGERVE